MSKEAFPVLPDKAAEHITHLPEDIQGSIGSLLLNLTHESLHQQNTSRFRRRKFLTPIPRESFTQEHHGHIDRVTMQMSGASELLGEAYTALEQDEDISTKEISAYVVADKARNIALERAQKAKATGAEQEAVSYLESVITIESLLAVDEDGVDEVLQRRKEVARSIVSRGLTNQFIDATHNTYDMVAIGKGKRNSVPLCSLAKENGCLLSAATTFIINDDFSKGVDDKNYDFGAHRLLEPRDIFSIANSLDDSEAGKKHRELLVRTLTDPFRSPVRSLDASPEELHSFFVDALKRSDISKQRECSRIIEFLAKHNLKGRLSSDAEDDVELRSALNSATRISEIEALTRANGGVRKEMHRAFGDYYGQLSRSIQLKFSRLVKKRPQSTELPFLMGSMELLGIDQTTAESMVESWLSFSSGAKTSDSESFSVFNPLHKHVPGMVNEQTNNMTQQFNALADYVIEFGIEETKEIIETFGIHNFSRYEPALLHDQMERWRKGDEAAVNIVVTAQQDWNGAIYSAGDEYAQTFESTVGLFLFEAGTAREVSEAAIKTGKRERKNGRDPDVENFVIHAHGSSESLNLATFKDQKKGRVTSSDYSDLAITHKWLRSNDYTKHLGHRYRVILKACSTAGKSDGGKNFAESMADHHNRQVTGSPRDTRGPIKVDSEGRTIYTVVNEGGKSTSKISGTVYGKPK